jgi:hypothetical protein
MDGVHISGRNAEGKRGKPQLTQPSAARGGDSAGEARTLQDLLQSHAHQVKVKTRARKAAGSAKDGTYGQMLDPGRRIVICAVTRSGVRAWARCGSE